MHVSKYIFTFFLGSSLLLYWTGRRHREDRCVETLLYVSDICLILCFLCSSPALLLLACIFEASLSFSIVLQSDFILSDSCSSHLTRPQSCYQRLKISGWLATETIFSVLFQGNTSAW